MNFDYDNSKRNDFKRWKIISPQPKQVGSLNSVKFVGCYYAFRQSRETMKCDVDETLIGSDKRSACLPCVQPTIQKWTGRRMNDASSFLSLFNIPAFMRSHAKLFILHKHTRRVTGHQTITKTIRNQIALSARPSKATFFRSAFTFRIYNFVSKCKSEWLKQNFLYHKYLKLNLINNRHI